MTLEVVRFYPTTGCPRCRRRVVGDLGAHVCGVQRCACGAWLALRSHGDEDWRRGTAHACAPAAREEPAGAAPQRPTSAPAPAQPVAPSLSAAIGIV